MLGNLQCEHSWFYHHRVPKGPGDHAIMYNERLRSVTGVCAILTRFYNAVPSSWTAWDEHDFRRRAAKRGGRRLERGLFVDLNLEVVLRWLVTGKLRGKSVELYQDKGSALLRLACRDGR